MLFAYPAPRLSSPTLSSRESTNPNSTSNTVGSGSGLSTINNHNTNGLMGSPGGGLLEPGSVHTNGHGAGTLTPTNSGPRYPHVRAMLASIIRQHDRYQDGYEPGDNEVVSGELLHNVVTMLEDEREDELKRLLKNECGIEEDNLEQNILELMHKRMDDVAGVPFLFLTPTRRPISRPNSRANSRPGSPSVNLRLNRPETPLAQLFKRPLTPATASLHASSYFASSTSPSSPSFLSSSNNMISSSPSSTSYFHQSPSSSPTLAHAQATYARAQYTASLPSSPLSSPRLLNAKAHEFKPIQRPLSSASSNPAGLRTETPSPDMWAPHGSPLRTSNLAIAAPLVPEQSGLRLSRTPGDFESDDDDDDEVEEEEPHVRDIVGHDEDEDDVYNPFPVKNTRRPFDFDHTSTNWSNSPLSSPEDYRASLYHNNNNLGSPPEQHSENAEGDEEYDDMLTEGMTPFDVLSSVFGTTLAPSELEDGLAANGYDFERAMAWLVERSMPAQPVSQPVQARMQNVGGRVTLVSRGSTIPQNGARRPAPGGNRVCRYFVAGECLRADCRFSHDLERALCRFWLRGTCAKNESCEFLHHLPKDVDVSALSASMNRASINPMNIPSQPQPQAPDEFPVLGFETSNGNGRPATATTFPYHDPSRTRFASAVKKSPSPASAANNSATEAARREAMGRHYTDNLYHRSAIIAPRPSPRIKLRGPSLLPTLPTGESINKLYLSYRSRALQLGAARNACLSRAADAWRRGDGAAAKRFSREGHELNGKMSTEMADAASRLVRERVALSVEAVKTRDAGWSDDPGDRSARGRVCGAGLGVCLGIASKHGSDMSRLTPEERTESMVDLHGLHANEATDVLEQFLLALEREHFYGLAFVVVGEEKHVGMQDPARGASRARLGKAVREFVHRWSYPWIERDGVICIDVQTHASE